MPLKIRLHPGAPAPSRLRLARAYLAAERRWVLRIGGALLLISLAWALWGLLMPVPIPA
ncbi:hypothetical protein HNQ51_001336 [Inhella inkyongensis]|uniref:Uncharacterized protein n=1 Tax=Inhella inkyongensis TaxID=392593 RepID=A0A840S2T0_9BURK|nr:hypothetical protein [Inhella inkyongensis]MBB5204043.1 hypothetical protein [Inhella inkyongensis]